MIVLWRVAERCNLACGFCAYDRRLPGMRQAIDGDTVAHFGQLLGDYQRHTGEAVHLSWLGGEPLLWPPLWNLSQRLREAGLRLSATTNGTTLGASAVREHILAHFAELTVSIDGPAPFHDAMRGWQDGWSCLRTHLRALVDARNERDCALKLRVNTVLMAQNVSDFPELCETLATWGVNEICFNALGGDDRPAFFPAHRLQTKHMRWLREQLPAMRKRLLAHGTHLVGSDRYLDRLTAASAGIPTPIDDCAPGEHFLFIDERGRIGPCSFTLEEYGIDVRSVRTLDDLLTLAPHWRRAQHQASRAPACDNCQANHMYAKFEA